MKLVYRKRVADEVSDVYEWYENQQQGLGEEFIANFEALIAAIVESPQIFARFDDKVRRATLTRFPYNVFYQAEKKTHRHTCSDSFFASSEQLAAIPKANPLS
jgi:hypothetical protein